MTYLPENARSECVAPSDFSVGGTAEISWRFHAAWPASHGPALRPTRGSGDGLVIETMAFAGGGITTGGAGGGVPRPRAPAAAPAGAAPAAAFPGAVAAGAGVLADVAAGVLGAAGGIGVAAAFAGVAAAAGVDGVEGFALDGG